VNPYFRGLAAAIMTGLTVYQYPQVLSLAALLNCQGTFPDLIRRSGGSFRGLFLSFINPVRQALFTA
jgi:hypothetical protein